MSSEGRGGCLEITKEQRKQSNGDIIHYGILNGSHLVLVGFEREGREATQDFSPQHVRLVMHMSQLLSQHGVFLREMLNLTTARGDGDVW